MLESEDTMNRIVLGIMGAGACLGAIIFGTGLIMKGETDELNRTLKKLSRRLDRLEVVLRDQGVEPPAKEGDSKS